MAVSHECSKEPSGSMKCGAFLDELRTSQFSGRILFYAISKFQFSDISS